ncbi:ribonucleoside-triphosphate reductase [Seminibacterium arietis]|uniref:Ribonucleoside-triphosphate reductase n=1 Tax=Seminibacterium arietis TaxID=1173502 RepID=A0ABW3I9V2_9PAST
MLNNPLQKPNIVKPISLSKEGFFVDVDEEQDDWEEQMLNNPLQKPNIVKPISLSEEGFFVDVDEEQDGGEEQMLNNPLQKPNIVKPISLPKEDSFDGVNKKQDGGEEQMLNNPLQKPNIVKPISLPKEDSFDGVNKKQDGGEEQMLNNPLQKPNIVKPISLPKEDSFDGVDKKQDGWDMFDDSAEDDSTSHQPLPLPSIEDSYSQVIDNVKFEDRKAVLKMDPREYQRIINELNDNAENKHYVLFFGQPGSGKTWIIASMLFYMKQYASGSAYLDSSKSSSHDLNLFYELQNYFSGAVTAKEISRTSDQQYSQFSMSFKPKNSKKPPIEIVFIDFSGEHSDLVMRSNDNQHSGKLPDYLNVILESKVNTKLAFVYDSSIEDQVGEPLQLNVLDEVFTQIRIIQRRENKIFPKALILSKADLIEQEEATLLAKSGWDATAYAKLKFPQFSNGFFNESDENVCILYKIGTISEGKLEQFDKNCPERFFNWLYKRSTGKEIIASNSLFKKFKDWFMGA